MIFSVPILRGQEQPVTKTSMATTARWDAPGWWPTKGTPAKEEYVGPNGCESCHSEITALQQKTAMFQAAQLARNSSIPEQGHGVEPPTPAFSVLRYAVF